jgi:large conductance mechanosensitive channel
MTNGLPCPARSSEEADVLAEFRDFINRGNFVDIAVAFVIGAAFGTVVSAFTGRIVTPLIGSVVSLDFDAFGQFGPLDANGVPAGSVGAFLEAFINFVIVGFVMFLVVKGYNAFKERTAEPAAEEGVSEPEDIVLLREIRDALVNR